MRHVELIVALTLTGCMRIYPDPELPDVKVEWGEQDCRGTASNVTITLTGVDEPSTETATVPCSDLGVTIANVARQRFHVAGSLLGVEGSVVSTMDSEVDLRNGFNATVELYFDGFSNVRFAWAFDGGATCASLGATSVAIALSLPDEPDVGVLQYPCELMRASGQAPIGTFTARVRAFSGDSVVAASAVTAPFEVTMEGFTDLGAVTLAACGATCP